MTDAGARNLGSSEANVKDTVEAELSEIEPGYKGKETECISVERGSSFLKDPLFFANSLFLKKPERIMALLMIMGLEALKAMNATTPN